MRLNFEDNLNGKSRNVTKRQKGAGRGRERAKQRIGNIGEERGRQIRPKHR